ncbi:Uroporphyrinogen decarboxylase in heme biosynthesis [Puccinia graminis f. sp. tritici]|uniref:Uroporphyrinogen decarboxylase n=1 Tax=Puccinia graminis f. sp. tritici TaxID=56615 RepID=A0A5B0NE16_PUCGR|nr:Uroporphyrinogen decarboxylase in heme biosynthesis [Puccinia graminis f. sp. tritici]
MSKETVTNNSPTNDLLLRAARGEKTERSPVWVMRQAGRYLPEFRKLRESHGFFEICRTPELATEVTMQPIKRYEGLLDGAIIFSDILVIPQALEMEVIMNPGPIFPNPISSKEQMEEMINKKISPEELKEKLNYVYEAIKLTTLELQNRIPLFGFVGAPWTLFAYMTSGGGGSGLNASKATSFDTAKNWIQVHPELSARLLEKLALVCALHLVNQIEAGCQIVQVFDSWAGELSDYDFEHFSLPYLRRVSTLVKEGLSQANIHPVPMVVFAKGANLPHQLQQLASSGYSTVSLDWKVRPAYAIEALESLSNSIALQGNLDPAVLHTDHQTIKKYVRLMFANQEAGGFLPHLPHITNLGHGITPGVDPEAMRTFLEAVHEESTKIRQS